MNTINDYTIVEQQVERSKIFRFSYRKIIGESLTSFVTKQKELGFNSLDTKNNLLTLESVILYLNKYPMMKEQFINNINISISSRFAEQKTYDNSKR